MYKGKYVAKIEYEFQFDENHPHILPIDTIRAKFTGEGLTKAIEDALADWVFDPEDGKLHASMISFDMAKED